MVFFVILVAIFLNFTAPNYFVQGFSLYLLAHCCVGLGVRWQEFITRREVEELVKSMQIDYALRVKNWVNSNQNKPEEWK